MSLEDFASYEETRHLLKSPRNAKRLLESIRRLDDGEGSRTRTAVMKLVFDEQAWADYLHWQATDPKLLGRLNALIRECTRTPFVGTGKPEPLRGSLAGWWSRRITREHRLVYRVAEDRLFISQCRYHY